MQKYIKNDTNDKSWSEKSVAARCVITIKVSYLHISHTRREAGGPCSIHCTAGGESEEQQMLLSGKSGCLSHWKLEQWSGPGSPQAVADRLALRRTLCARPTRCHMGLMGSLRRPRRHFIEINRTAPLEGRRAESIPGPVNQRPQNRPGRLPEKRAGGGMIPGLKARCRVWERTGEVSSERSIVSCSEPQTFTLRSEELSSFLQAGGETVLVGEFVASSTVLSSRLFSLRRVLEEEDCVLEDLSFFNSPFSRFLQQKLESTNHPVYNI